MTPAFPTFLTQASGLFITGSDTAVGKTWVATRLIAELQAAGKEVGCYKPVCSGAEKNSQGDLYWEDITRLSQALGERYPTERICPQRYFAPLAPPLAARLEHRCVDPLLISSGLAWWRTQVPFLLVEGAGGFLSPLTESTTNAELALECGLPVLVIVPQRLGAINQALLTIEAVRSRNLPLAGVVLNSVQPPDDSTEQAARSSNAREIERYGKVDVWELEHGAPEREN